MHSKTVIITPAITFFLYFNPFDLSTNPKTVDAIGTGVSKKNSHIFSINNPFTVDTVLTKTNAPNIDKREATNNIIDITLLLFVTGLSMVFVGFLYMYE